VSFRLRVFLLVMLVAVSAIGATAWLTLNVASQGYSRAQTAAQRHRNDLVDELERYGLTHGQWGGVSDVASRLSQRTDLRVRLVTLNGEVLVDTDTLQGQTARPITPVPALVDPRPTLDPTIAEQPPDLTPPRPDVIPFDHSRLFTPPATWTADARGKTSRMGMVARQLDQYRAAQLILRCIKQVDPQAEAVMKLTVSPYLDDGQLAKSPDCVQRATDQVFNDSATQAADQDALTSCVIKVFKRQDLANMELSCLDAAFTTRIGGLTAVPLQLYLGAVNDEPIGLLGRSALVGSIGLLLVAIVGTALVARRVSRPVRRLTLASQRLAKGELDVSVPTDGSDELGQLSRSFNKMAGALQRSEERQRRLIADVAHELRTPLSNLRGYLEALQDGVVPPTREVFASLHEEAMLQWRILQDLQVLALAEAGGLAYAAMPVDLAELAASRTTAHGATADVDLVVEAPSPVWVEVDPDRFRQVLGNLLSNAIRHSSAGGKVRVRVFADAGTATLEVHDTGCGIAPEDLPRVFDRFWRADPTRQRATGGTGLGLTITHRIVADLGGRIEVASQVGLGTVFTVRLPALRMLE
jgi:two-component system sensor histidine kinase BaeS